MLRKLYNMADNNDLNNGGNVQESVPSTPLQPAIPNKPFPPPPPFPPHRPHPNDTERPFDPMYDRKHYKPLPKPPPPPINGMHTGETCPKIPGNIDLEINNLAEFKHYLKTILGQGVVCVEITDAGLDYIIKDSLLYFKKYAFDGSQRTYLRFELQPGQNLYKMCDDLEAVVDIQTSSWLGSINELFTVPHNLMYSEFAGGMAAGGVMGLGTSTQNAMGYDMLGNWNSTVMAMKEWKANFGPNYSCKFDRLERMLEVTPTPKERVRVLLEVYLHTRTRLLFNDPLFRQYAEQLALIRWARPLAKYTVTLAGGGQLNMGNLLSEAKQSLKELEERIEKENPNCYVQYG